MAKFVVSLIFAFCLFQSACGGRVSPVQKVLQMIDQAAVKVQRDLDETSKLFEGSAKFCDDEAFAKDFAIKDSTEKIEQLQAVIEDSNAKISSLEETIQETSANIAGQEGDLHESIVLRQKEHDQFVTSEKSQLEMIDSLEGAKKAFAGLQTETTPETKQNADKIVASLKQMVESEYVTHEERQKVQAFLQDREDSEDSFTLKSESGGNDGTLAVLGKLGDFSMDTLSNMRKKEMENAHSHAMLQQSLESELRSLKEELNQAASQKHMATQMLAEAEKDLAREAKAKDADQASLDDLKADCQTKAREFEAQSRDANGELTALGKAKDILTKKFSLLQSGIQTISRSTAQAHDDEEDDHEDARARALRQIEQLGKKFHSTALVTLSYRASSSPFAKVTGMVEDMIAKLQKEAAEEATQKAFCDTELGTSEKSKAQKQASLDKTNARIDEGNSGVAKLTEGVQVLSKEITDIDTGNSEATAIRNKEKTEFDKVEKDYSESEDACASAIQVLREYYEGASLVEVSASNAGTATKGEGIIGILEVAESDFAKMLAEARTAEETAIAEYNKFSQDQRLAKATKEVDSKAKQSELKTLKTALANYNEDKEGVSAELEAVLAYLDKLKPQCETQVETYAQRKANREAEIVGLKDALSILSDSAGVALVQREAVHRHVALRGA